MELSRKEDDSVRQAHSERARETYKRPRSDALPEHTDYLDTGCQFYARCLTCPFEECLIESKILQGRTPKAERSIAFKRWTEGIEGKNIALELGVSPRTVWRYIRAEKKKRGMK